MSEIDNGIVEDDVFTNEINALKQRFDDLVVAEFPLERLTQLEGETAKIMNMLQLILDHLGLTVTEE